VPRLIVAFGTQRERYQSAYEMQCYSGIAPVKKQVEYDPTIWGQRDTQRVQRMEPKLQRQARQIRYKLVPVEQNPAQ
jgi:hypothetical protein